MEELQKQQAGSKEGLEAARARQLAAQAEEAKKHEGDEGHDWQFAPA